MALLARVTQSHAPQLSLYVKDQGQRMDLPSLLANVDQNTRVYACGPARLIEALESLSVHWPEGVLHCEHFSAADLALDPSKERAFTVHLQDSNLSITVPPNQTLLHALQATGVDVPCDCGEGLCGTCEVAVLKGKIDHRDKVLSPSERATHQRMMACCSRAADGVVTLAL
jgi:ferredoxin